MKRMCLEACSLPVHYGRPEDKTSRGRGGPYESLKTLFFHMISGLAAQFSYEKNLKVAQLLGNGCALALRQAPSPSVCCYFLSGNPLAIPDSSVVRRSPKSSCT